MERFAVKPFVNDIREASRSVSTQRRGDTQCLLSRLRRFRRRSAAARLPPIAKEATRRHRPDPGPFCRGARQARAARRKGRDRPPIRTQITGLEFQPRAAAAGCSSLRSADAAAAPARARDRRRSRSAPDASAGPTGSPTPMARDARAIGVASCRSGLARIFASTRSNGPRLGKLRRRKAGGADRLHQMSGLVEPRILARDLHRRAHRCRSPARALCSALAAAMASTPVPVPRSSTRRGRCAFSTWSSSSRQPRVVP